MPESTSPHHPPPEEKFHFEGPVGRLEARWRPASPRAVGRTALLCHPHPLFGGSLANKVLYRLAKRLSGELGIPSLRFNYRGAGESDGVHDHGRGEVDDTHAALDELRRRAEGAKLMAIGYSFGAAIGLRAAAAAGDVDTLVALGLPVLREWELDWLLRASAPLLVVQAEHDEFGQPEDVARRLEGRASPTRIHVVEGTTHLFPDHADDAVDAVLAYIRALDPPAPDAPVQE